MRDQFKTKEYFFKYIEDKEYWIKKYIKSMMEKRMKKNSALLAIRNFYMELIIAKYSSGYEIKEIEIETEKMIDFYYDSSNESLDINPTYYEKFQMLSFIYLFKLNKEFLKKIKWFIEKSRKAEKNDWWLNFFINPIEENYKMGTHKICFKTYQKYYDLVNTSDKDMQKILFDKIIHRPFYKGHYYADSHKDERLLYFGYWNFELAALGKILKIDDSNLKDCKYYPYDLVHYNEK
jgi:hypothetical protein